MKMNKCFTTVFDPVLKQEGFARKGILYYRRMGHMLQGIKLKPMNPCMINFTSFPYWIYDLRTRQIDQDMTKGYWVEDGGMLVTGADFYFFKDADEENLQKMENVLTLCRQYILPYFDKICNEEEYLQLTLKGRDNLLPMTSMGDTFIRAEEKMQIEVMLYNQYFTDSSVTAEEHLDIWYQNEYQTLVDCMPYWADNPENVENFVQYREKLRNNIASMREADFSVLYKSMCENMRVKIQEQLKINFE